jgi:DNA-binding MarR family transcriptional regulator
LPRVPNRAAPALDRDAAILDGVAIAHSWVGVREIMRHVEINPVCESSAPQQLIAEQLEHLQLQIDTLREQLTCPAAPADGADKFVLKFLVQEILRSRRRRENLFGCDLFGEPAWDILLELFLAELVQRNVSVSDACYASAVPHTTALRWVGKLEQDGWVKRISDPHDGRRSWLQLTDQSSDKMRRLLNSLTVRPMGVHQACSGG